MSSHSSSSGRLSLPRLKTPGNSTLQPYHNNNELSALSCSSIVSQIIGQYIYTPLTAAPESYEAATVEENQLYWDEKQLYWEETKETVEDMIYALDRVLGMAPGSNVGKEEAKEEKKMEVPVVWPEVRVEKQEWPEVKVENQELYWGEQKESVEDMINALNRVIERGSSGTPTSDGYTPLTATAENFRLDIMAEPEVVRMRFCAKEEVVVEVEEEEREEEGTSAPGGKE
ncbi:hypothetical protein BZA05DRAFT_190072 [Tricharina praecox]|uniref:uncharacterized protein n=1 Tax=Tricharina praecox TaxID=43433 RepID=UPI00221FECA5|nr:uncharacterized protein BZA05DRAFT_190072 [Tricharina praecox]KAI5842873.1 hypothetical protein BZA05DRAFT_190072 [Tricharina praecox]